MIITREYKKSMEVPRVVSVGLLAWSDEGSRAGMHISDARSGNHIVKVDHAARQNDAKAHAEAVFRVNKKLFLEPSGSFVSGTVRVPFIASLLAMSALVFSG